MTELDQCVMEIDKIVAYRGPGTREGIQYFLGLLRDDPRMTSFLETNFRKLSEEFLQHPEIAPPLDWGKLSVQFSAVAQSVLESGSLDHRDRIKPEVSQAFETLNYLRRSLDRAKGVKSYPRLQGGEVD